MLRFVPSFQISDATVCRSDSEAEGKALTVSWLGFHFEVTLARVVRTFPPGFDPEPERPKAGWVEGVYVVTPAEAEEWVELINFLREDECDAIEIVADNADFNGFPNCAVVASGLWCGMNGKDFRADSVIECLRLAAAAKREAA